MARLAAFARPVSFGHCFQKQLAFQTWVLTIKVACVTISSDYVAKRIGYIKSGNSFTLYNYGIINFGLG